MNENYEPSPFRQIIRKERSCLKCNKKFESTGPANRLCETCNYTNSKLKSARSSDMMPKPKALKDN